jgi:hypothetical protein
LAVTYRITGSATNGVDYETLSGTITIPANATISTIWVEPLPNELSDVMETLTLTITGLSSTDYTISSTYDTATLNIFDHFSVDQSGIAHLSVPEGIGSVLMGVHLFYLANPDLPLYVVPGEHVTYHVAMSDGPAAAATAGQDYTDVSGTKQFAVGTCTNTFNVPILDDSIPEPDQNFTVTFSNLHSDIQNLTWVGPNVFVITIVDNDPKPQMALEINGDGDADNYVKMGDLGGTLTITMQGGSASQAYLVHVTDVLGHVTFGPNRDSALDMYLNGGGTVVGVQLNGVSPGWFTVTSTSLDADPTSASVTGAVVKLDLQRNGTSITDMTTDVIVGQKMSLTSVLQPAGLTIASRQWTVPGGPIKDYTQAQAKAEVTQLAAADLQGANVDQYYWIDGGNGREVTCQVVIAGITFDAKTTFNVLRPAAKLTAEYMTEYTISDPVVNVGGGIIGVPISLHFGTHTPLRPGITWTGTVTTPVGGTGEIAMLQTINPLRRVQDNDGTFFRLTTNGVYVLDDEGTEEDGKGCVLKRSRIQIADSEVKTSQHDDTPVQPVTAEQRWGLADDYFHLYLVYRPSGQDSIWVTLRRLVWHWHGSATKDGQGNWSMDEGAFPPTPPGTPPPSHDTTELPLWNSYFTRLVDEGFVRE